MSKKIKIILTSLGFTIAVVFVFAASKSDIYAEIIKSQRLVNSVYKNLIANYVDDFDVDAFTRMSIEDMVGELDPYTVFIEAEDRYNLDLLATGKYGGVGIQIGKREDRLTVITPMDDTPAKKAGITNGDVIVKIDSTLTDELSLDVASDMIRGLKGTKVILTIERFGNEELLEFELTRADITVKDVAYAEMIDDNIGYVRLTRFSKNSGPEMRTALNKFVENDASAFILDLRNNPGGLLGSSIEILEMIIPKGQLLLTTKGRNKESNREIYSERTPIIPTEMEIVVLINEGSASASEIVAGTLQDLDRAVIIGKRSYGKGLVQSVVGLDKEHALKITTAKYYTPSGRLIQKPGYINEKLVIPTTNEDTTFVTVGGRIVKAGGGIEPDFEIEVNYNYPLSYECLRKGAFFSYVQKHKQSYSSLQELKKDVQLLDDFQNYLVEIELEVITAGEKALNDTKKKLSEIDSTNADLIAAFDIIEGFIENHEATLFEKETEKITELLYDEFASVYEGEKGRFKEQLKYDQTVNEALTILQNNTVYNSVFAVEN
ncbi:MAG: PDZ domain-containing protein [Planctomycetia bacterium]|nr:PDZ domain-containing protein [Planctomycetia bacterium]